MSDLVFTCERVCERFADNSDDAYSISALGRLLDFVERERAKLNLKKPKLFDDPKWEEAFMWDARVDVRDAERAYELAKGAYYGTSRALWLDQLEEITRKNFTLRDVWAKWYAVGEARRAFNSLPEHASARERIDTEVALDRAEAVYDRIYRRFYHLEERTRDYLAVNQLRGLRPPRRKPAPFGGNRHRGISTFVGGNDD